MASEKDRLGDKLRDVEKAREDQYFAKRDRELIAKLRGERDQELRDDLKAVGELRCPRGHAQLQSRMNNNLPPGWTAATRTGFYERVAESLGHNGFGLHRPR